MIRFVKKNFLCLSHSSLDFDFCSVPNLPCLRQFIHSFDLQRLPIFILLGTSTPKTTNLWTLPTFSELSNMSHDDLTSLSLQQHLLRLSFVPKMRRNLTFGSASSRPSLQRKGSNHRNSNMPMPSPTCPSGHFGYPRPKRLGL
jgi:hypothetical protein